MKINIIKFSELMNYFKSKPPVQKKDNRGGKREGAGPPLKYGETTVNVTLRVPISRKAEVKELVYSYLEKYKIK
jgi:hypothetical protein